MFPEEYEKRYGQSVLEHLEELFLPVGDYKKTRIQFWKMVTDLFSNAYFKQIHQWCQKRGLKFTGHIAQEENLEIQVTSNGACMPHYEYFDMPGMDWLGRRIFPCLTPMQVSSVAEQLGKEAVLSENFALCGHGVSFGEMKGIYEWQMAHGINRLCQHLMGYSLRGMRKRDYPPALYYQQPWWEEYPGFLETLSRTGMLLAKGEKEAKVLLIHPQTTVWSLFDSGKNRGIEELNEKFLNQMQTLERKHIVYHLGDETILERHGRVEGQTLCVGKQRYTTVVASCGDCCLSGTRELLERFRESGGVICKAEEIAENRVCSNPDITYTKRNTPQGAIHYFVNTSGEEKRAEIFVPGYALDVEEGRKKELTREHCFEPWGSLMVLEDSRKSFMQREERSMVSFSDSFRITEITENILTLDFCDYYFDGVLQEKNGYVLNIAERASALEKRVRIRMDFHVKAKEVPDKMALICEIPRQYRFLINGKAIVPRDQGYFMDKSFRRLDISGCLGTGENTITLLCDFEQSPEFHKNMRQSWEFESEKNKLTYDIEIEAIYLVGDFGVETPGKWEALQRRGMRYRGEFILAKRPETIRPAHMEQQGFPFFAGSITLEGEGRIPSEKAVIKFKRRGIHVIKGKIGSYERTLLTKDELPLDGMQGKQRVTLTCINSLRNMLGPHHLKEGECYETGPNSFYKESCVWNPKAEEDWEESYCFVETGIL